MLGDLCSWSGSHFPCSGRLFVWYPNNPSSTRPCQRFYVKSPNIATLCMGLCRGGIWVRVRPVVGPNPGPRCGIPGRRVGRRLAHCGARGGHLAVRQLVHDPMRPVTSPAPRRSPGAFGSVWGALRHLKNFPDLNAAFTLKLLEYSRFLWHNNRQNCVTINNDISLVTHEAVRILGDVYLCHFVKHEYLTVTHIIFPRCLIYFHLALTHSQSLRGTPPVPTGSRKVFPCGEEDAYQDSRSRSSRTRTNPAARKDAPDSSA